MISRRAVMALTFICMLAFGITAALAGGGTLTYKKKEIQESNGGWHLAMTIVLPAPPATPHQVVKFSFTPTAYYERYLDDQHGEKPQLRKQPLVGQVPIVESVDVDFSDARGKVYNRTIFDFTITRSHNFAAGEYSVTVRKSDGGQLGPSQTLTLQGDNPVIDRRAISFVDSKGDKNKKKEAAAPAASSSAESKNTEAPKEADQASADQPTSPAAAPASDENSPPDSANAEKVPPTSHGCGCTTVGTTGVGTSSALLFAFGLAALRRRRREPRSQAQ